MSKTEEKADDATSREAAKHHFEQFMKAIGADPEGDEHLEDTPRRVVDSRMDEIFRGIDEDPKDHLRTAFEEGAGDGFVIVDNIEVQSMCGHHFLPFHGHAHIGYIPDGKIVGLSKFARLVDGYARRPQVQERLTSQVADAIKEVLDPRAVLVLIECEHECMTCRGVQDPYSMTRTSEIRIDDDMDKHSIKQEFFQMVKNGGR